MKVPSSRAADCLVQKYIGSAYDKVKEVADVIGDVSVVANAVDEVKAVGTNIDNVNLLANSLPEYRIQETFTLVQGNQTITTTDINVNAAEVSISSPYVDSRPLVLSEDYTVTGSNQINFTYTYPVDVKIIVTQYLYQKSV
ncbi:hypothetical protein 12VC501_gene0071 [Vibrio phage 12VC501]|nr:hypothetical protein 12VC501_gene0071 [Vibrio phage 12VC501]